MDFNLHNRFSCLIIKHEEQNLRIKNCKLICSMWLEVYDANIIITEVM